MDKPRPRGFKKGENCLKLPRYNQVLDFGLDSPLYSVFVFVFASVCVFVKCNAISMLDYIYLLQHKTNELIYTGRLAFESSCLCLRICLCVCLCLCLSRHQMNPGAVPFPTMFNMVLEP